MLENGTIKIQQINKYIHDFGWFVPPFLEGKNPGFLKENIVGKFPLNLFFLIIYLMKKTALFKSTQKEMGL